MGTRTLLAAVSVLALGACGGGDGGGDERPGGASDSGAAATERFAVRAGLCFDPAYLRTLAGENLDAAAEDPAELRRAVEQAFAPSLEAAITRSERLAPPELESAVAAVLEEMERGLRQVRDEPRLVVDGRVPALLKAGRLAREEELERCLPAFDGD